MPSYIEWGALADVVVVGLIVGAGLPAIFALGVRALEGPGSHDEMGRRSRIRVAAAVLCFAVIVSAVVTAIFIIRAHKH